MNSDQPTTTTTTTTTTLYSISTVSIEVSSTGGGHNPSVMSSGFSIPRNTLQHLSTGKKGVIRTHSIVFPKGHNEYSPSQKDIMSMSFFRYPGVW